MESDGLRQRKLPQKRPPIRQSISANKTKKSTSSFCSCMKYATLIFGAIFATLSVYLYYAPAKIDATPYSLPERPEFIGPLTPNDMLKKAERLYVNEIQGPESMVVYKGAVYTGTHDGKIVELKDGKIRTLKASRFNCGSYEAEPLCGRPLGIRLLDNDTLIYLDSYLGMFRLDIATGKSQLLVEGGQMVNGQPLSFLDDLVLLDNGTVLFTDASSKYTRRDFMLNILEHTDDGRVLSYDLNTQELRVISDRLYFPNGIEKSNDESYVLITETTKARILKLHLSGSKANQLEIFADNLPGFPDNIRSSHNNSFWVAMATARRRDGLSLMDTLGQYPSIRNFLTKLLPVNQLSSVTHSLSPKYGLVVLLDAQGRIVSSLHDQNGSVIPDVSQATTDDDGSYLYLGSFHSPFLGRLKL